MGILAVGTKSLHGIKWVPQCSVRLTVYNKFGEKPTVILLYTYINRHARTLKQRQKHIVESYLFLLSNEIKLLIKQSVKKEERAN